MFSELARRELCAHLPRDAVDYLAERVTVIVNRPPAAVPTTKEAMRQLERLDDAARGLQQAMDAAPWVVGSLSRYRPGKFSDAIFRRRLDDLRAVVREAAGDFYSAPGGANTMESERGNRPDPVVREVVREVLDALVRAGKRLSQTPTGAAAVCAQIVFNDIGEGCNGQVPDELAARFLDVSAADQVRAMLGSRRRRTAKAAG